MTNIIQFPTKSRPNYIIVTGSAWYHDNAIKEEVLSKKLKRELGLDKE